MRILLNNNLTYTDFKAVVLKVLTLWKQCARIQKTMGNKVIHPPAIVGNISLDNSLPLTYTTSMIKRDRVHRTT